MTARVLFDRYVIGDEVQDYVEVARVGSTVYVVAGRTTRVPRKTVTTFQDEGAAIRSIEGRIGRLRAKGFLKDDHVVPPGQLANRLLAN